jgi:hypothetical protein
MVLGWRSLSLFSLRFLSPSRPVLLSSPSKSITCALCSCTPYLLVLLGTRDLYLRNGPKRWRLGKPERKRRWWAFLRLTGVTPPLAACNLSSTRSHLTGRAEQSTAYLPVLDLHPETTLKLATLTVGYPDLHHPPICTTTFSHSKRRFSGSCICLIL